MIRFEHIGWQRNVKSNTDKVWGIILLRNDAMDFGTGNYGYVDNTYLSFWGRRGAKLQTKVFKDSARGASQMFNKKTSSGYKEVDKDMLDEVYPDFQQDLEKTAFWATLKL